jgi:rifampin ADP-ribosylating transferase
MEFSPTHPIIQLCIKGMALEEQGQPESAATLFQQAWSEATNDFEKYTSAFFVARHQPDVAGRLRWLETTLALALQIPGLTVASALPTLHTHIADCLEQLGESERAAASRASALLASENLHDEGPFYHGTRADLQIGDLLTAGWRSNYQPEIIMNHVYFTAAVNAAGFAAALALGEGRERVYIVEPTGKYENDPNVTDKKFPGNPTRSYRTSSPLKIVGEATDWVRLSTEDIQKWRERLAANKGDILN